MTISLNWTNNYKMVQTARRHDLNHDLFHYQILSQKQTR